MQSHPSSRRVTRGAHTLALSLILSLALTPLIETANASQTPTPTLATVQNKLASTSVPWVPNAGQWDARAAFRAQSFAGAVWVTTDGKLVHQFNGARANVAADATASANVGAEFAALSGRPEARPSPRLPKSVRGEPVESRSPGWVLTERFVGGAIKQAPRGSDPHIGRVSFMTSDTVAQADNLPSYGQVELGEVFPGVSVALKATNANVEKLFTVAPGRDPSVIRMAVDGAERLSIGSDGSLIATTGNGDIAFTAPIAFQEIDGVRKEVAVAYRLVGASSRMRGPGALATDTSFADGESRDESDLKRSPTLGYTFILGRYDHARPLVIDPLLASTYLGGSADDQINALAIHPHTGDVYVSGQTNSSPFPQSAGGAQPSRSVSTSCFVSRYRADLSQLIQSTYLGDSAVDCNALAIHPASGAVYVAGHARGTSSFPAGSLTNAIQPTHANPGNGTAIDGFAALLSADLKTLTQVTFYGGGGNADFINAIAVHPFTGHVHITGHTNSSALPGTVVGTQTSYGGGLRDGFIARLPATLTGAANVRYTFIGGSIDDQARALAIDPRSGDVLVTGYSDGGFPPQILVGAAQASFAGNRDAFVARLTADLSTVVRATFLGGTDLDDATSLAISPISGEVLVTGNTRSNNFPQTLGGAQPAFGGIQDGFVTRLTADLKTIVQSTYLGGSAFECFGGCTVAIHPHADEVFVSGDTAGGLSATLVPATASQPAYAGNDDAYIVRLNAALTAVRGGTYLGGSGLDAPYALAIEPSGAGLVVAGRTGSSNFPTANAVQTSTGGGTNGDAFVSRLSIDLTAVNRRPNPFSFIHQSHVPPNTVRTSNEVQIVITPTPPDNQQVAYVMGGSNSEFCVTNTAGCCATPLPACSGFVTGWIATPYEFLSGDRIAVRHTSANPGGTTETKLIISGQAYPFRSSTGNANIACNLDMNGDNVYSHTVEGLILIRAMLGFGADAIVAGTGVFPWDPVRLRLNEFCGTNFPFSPSAFQ